MRFSEKNRCMCGLVYMRSVEIFLECIIGFWTEILDFTCPEASKMKGN